MITLNNNMNVFNFAWAIDFAYGIKDTLCLFREKNFILN
jgi:hypothetical protein